MSPALRSLLDTRIFLHQFLLTLNSRFSEAIIHLHRRDAMLSEVQALNKTKLGVLPFLHLVRRHYGVNGI